MRLAPVLHPRPLLMAKIPLFLPASSCSSPQMPSGQIEKPHRPRFKKLMMLSSSQTPAAPADFSHLLYKSLHLRVPDFQPSLMQQGRSPGQPGSGSASPQPDKGCSSSSHCCPSPCSSHLLPCSLQRFVLKRTNVESNQLPPDRSELF